MCNPSEIFESIKSYDTEALGLFRSVSDIALYKFCRNKHSWTSLSRLGTIHIYHRKIAPFYGMHFLDETARSSACFLIDPSTYMNLRGPFLLLFLDNAKTCYGLWCFSDYKSLRLNSLISSSLRNSEYLGQSLFSFQPVAAKSPNDTPPGSCSSASESFDKNWLAGIGPDNDDPCILMSGPSIFQKGIEKRKIKNTIYSLLGRVDIDETGISVISKNFSRVVKKTSNSCYSKPRLQYLNETHARRRPISNASSPVSSDNSSHSSHSACDINDGESRHSRNDCLIQLEAISDESEFEPSLEEAVKSFDFLAFKHSSSYPFSMTRACTSYSSSSTSSSSGANVLLSPDHFMEPVEATCTGKPAPTEPYKECRSLLEAALLHCLPHVDVQLHGFDFNVAPDEFSAALQRLISGDEIFMESLFALTCALFTKVTDLHECT